MKPNISVTHLGDPSPGGPKSRGRSAVPALPQHLTPSVVASVATADKCGRARLGPRPCAPRGGQWRASEPRDQSPHLPSRHLRAAGPACQQGRSCHGMTCGCQQHLFAEQSRQPLSVVTVPSPRPKAPPTTEPSVGTTGEGGQRVPGAQFVTRCWDSTEPGPRAHRPGAAGNTRLPGVLAGGRGSGLCF